MSNDFYRQPDANPEYSIPQRRDWFTLWASAVTNPTLENYRDLLDEVDTSASRGFNWLFITTMVIVFFQTLINLFLNSVVTTNATTGTATLSDNFLCLFLCLVPIAGLVVVFFNAIFLGLVHLVATGLGGQGDYSRLVYLTMTFQCPITIITGLINLIPILGACINLFILVYQLYLGVVATNAVHQNGWLYAAIAYAGTAIGLFVLLVGSITALIVLVAMSNSSSF